MPKWDIWGIWICCSPYNYEYNDTKIKVRSENLEPFSRNKDNSPDCKGICVFLFACCQECVEVYNKVFTENKNQKIRAKNAKIGFATPR